MSILPLITAFVNDLQKGAAYGCPKFFSPPPESIWSALRAAKEKTAQMRRKTQESLILSYKDAKIGIFPEMSLSRANFSFVFFSCHRQNLKQINQKIAHSGEDLDFYSEMVRFYAHARTYFREKC